VKAQITAYVWIPVFVAMVILFCGVLVCMDKINAINVVLTHQEDMAKATQTRVLDLLVVMEHIKDPKNTFCCNEFSGAFALDFMTYEGGKFFIKSPDNYSRELKHCPFCGLVITMKLKIGKE
jgi:hypothetical protein